MSDDRPRDDSSTDADDLLPGGGSTTRGSDFDTALDTSRTGGVGGMAGTLGARENTDTDMAGTEQGGEVEDQ